MGPRKDDSGVRFRNTDPKLQKVVNIRAEKRLY